MSDALEKAKKRVADSSSNYGARPHFSETPEYKRKKREEKINRILDPDLFAAPNRPGHSGFVHKYLESPANMARLGIPGSSAEKQDSKRKTDFTTGKSWTGKLHNSMWNETEAWQRGPPKESGDPAPAAPPPKGYKSGLAHTFPDMPSLGPVGEVINVADLPDPPVVD